MGGLLMLSMLLGCGSKLPVADPSNPSIPHIPAPQAPMYSVEIEMPKDFLVKEVARELPWSEALSGAAAEVALKVTERPIRLEDAKWAAIRAGYPYPIYNVIVGDVDVDQYPKDLRAMLLKEKAGRIGVVRVRKGIVDRWVVLLSEEGGLTAGFPREIEGQEPLKVDGVGTGRLLAPDGTTSTFQLPLERSLSQAGEWWMELDTARSRISIPFYVDAGTPVHPLFVTETEGLVLSQPTQMEEEALILFEDMRERQGLHSQFDESQLLNSFTRQALDSVLQQTWNEDENLKLLEKVGFVGGPLYQVHCEGATVYSCLDSLSYTIDGRRALLDPAIRALGIAAHVQTNGVVLVLSLSAI